MQPLLQLANKLLQPQQQPQLQKLASYVHYYPEQIYPASLAHSQGAGAGQGLGGRVHVNKGRPTRMWILLFCVV